jgi:hypothetical protein
MISMDSLGQAVWNAGSYSVGCGKIEEDEVLAQGVSLYGDVSRALRRRGGPCLRLPAKL